MKVYEVMTRDVLQVSPDTTIMEVAKIMEVQNVGCVLIMEKQEIRGIVTDRDIVVRGVAQKRDPANLTVKEIMTPNVVALREDADISFALNLMRQHSIRRLPVLNERGEVVGILSISDVARVIDLDIENYLNLLSHHLKVL